MKKPTGNQGTYRVTVNVDGTANGEFIRDELGNTKEEIERRVVELFAKAWAQQTGVSFEWSQNQESDVDITLELPGGRVGLELTELILHDGKSSPFATPNRSRTFGQYADAILERVTRKSAHYGQSKTPLHLLIYVTHEPFDAPDQAITLAQLKIRELEHPPVFENIFYLQRLPSGPVVRCLYPVPDKAVAGFKPEVWQDRAIIIVDLEQAEFTQSRNLDDM